MSDAKKSPFKKILKYLAHVDMFILGLIVLIVLVFVGTISQKTIGLHNSQMKYFSAWITFLGPIPFPGARTVLVVMFVNLVSMMATHRWTKKKLGIFVTHSGAILLFVGCGLTGFFSTEGSMRIDEGASSNFVADYHNLEFAITKHLTSNKERVYAFQEGWLKGGELIKHSEFPFQIKVIEFFANCDIVQRKTHGSNKLKGFAKRFQFLPKAIAPEYAQNRQAIIVEVTGSDQDGLYYLFEGMQIDQTLQAKENQYNLEFRRERRYLPFQITLNDFQKSDHPGTSMARAYRSIVELQDKDWTQRSVVQMNEPLRYGGRTFYQSSYIIDEGKETTVLAVVHNYGRLFPYISSIIMCIGLFIHLILLIPGLFSSKKKEQ
ncbi:MAG: cytochrome c biogenesis protein ResB [Candidatus Cloacimonetes bacterium]|nr:cytochrome c biogenesis protein ResB [Candidatus Cloacimonadota bacterium]